MTVDPQILKGLRVLSFCHYLQGPAASQYLADMGADVVKVEPLDGAFERHWSGGDTFVGDGISAFFLSGNRNKRSLAVDLKSEEGREIIRRLIARYDVVLENYRPGVLARLGFDYDEAKRINPRIIYASASGYGPTGPAATQPGQDLLIQARVGFMTATGDAGRAPTPVGFSAADQHGAALLALGILGAYVRALKTGLGTRIEGNLFNAGIDLQAEALTLYYSGGRDAQILERDGHLATWFHPAPYGVYQVRDAFVALSLNNLGALERALATTTLAALANLDPYVERDRIAEAVAQALADRSFDEVATAFDAEGIWYQRVQNYDALRTDPQAVHNGVFQTIEVGGGVATIVAHPLRYDGRLPETRHLALWPGADTTEILAEIGLSEGDIARLVERGVINRNRSEGVRS